MIKSLGNSATLEQKVAQLAKNFIELERESNRQTASLKQNEKVLEKEQREKEHLQREYNKGVLIRYIIFVTFFQLKFVDRKCLYLRRDKLEQVCREQQKLMKSIKSESMTKIRDEEEKRKETQAHFQKSINEIFTTLGKNNDENLKIKEANTEMTKKFKYLAEQYELREKQLEKLNEQIKLETQLNEAKLAKVQMESTIEKEILLKEKQAALEEVLATKKSIIEMETRERVLKEQLKIYTEKYDQFQDSLAKSNGIFATYKTEIEKMSKRTKTLEKEAVEWRSKYEKSNRALLNTISDKQAQDEYVKKSARQLSQLQKLCRTLQAERSVLLDVLKTNNLERPAMPELPPEPKDIEQPPQPSDKLDMMTQNCKELKETLAQLQGQLNAIEKDEKPKGKVEAALVQSKKQKPKKNKAKNGKGTVETLSNGDNDEPSSTTADGASSNAIVTTTEESKTEDNVDQAVSESTVAETTVAESAVAESTVDSSVNLDQLKISDADEQTNVEPDSSTNNEVTTSENTA